MTVSTAMRFFSDQMSKEIRDRFSYVDADPFSGKRIFFDAASGSLRLKSMLKARYVQSGYPDQLARVSPASKNAEDVMKKGFQDVKDFVGAKSGIIIPGMNGTHAIFRVVNAILANAPGTNVVTTDLEHPSVYDATAHFADLYGKQWRVAHFDLETGFVAPEAILEKVDKNTCLVGLIHASNTTGAVLDVRTVVDSCRKINPNVFIIADGVQYAPHGIIDVGDLGIDAYAFSPYKVYCVKGIGFCYLSERMANLKHWSLRGKAPDDWILGSPDDSAYAAWSAVVDYLVWLGSHFTDSKDRRTQIVAAMTACSRHDQALLNRCLYGTEVLPGLLKMNHVKVHCMTDDLSNRFPLMLFSISRMNAYQAVEKYNRAGIHLHFRSPDAYTKHTLTALGLEGAIRLSASHYNTPEEIDAFLETTRKMAELSDNEIANIPESPAKRAYGEG